MAAVLQLRTNPQFTSRPREISEYPPIMHVEDVKELLDVSLAHAYQIIRSEGCPRLITGKRRISVPRDLFWEYLLKTSTNQEIDWGDC